MRMFNPDGTEAQMCGNATRCVARYVYERGLVREKVIRIETGAGIKVARLILDEGQVSGATIDMGEPILGMAAIPLKVAEGQDPNAMYVKKSLEIMGQTWNVTCVSMGNPHCVVFLGENDPELMDMDLEKIGPCFEHNELFPERVNKIRHQRRYARVGARHRRDHGLRHRCLRNGRCLRAQQSHWPHSGRAPARRSTSHQLERARQPRLHDRARSAGL